MVETVYFLQGSDDYLVESKIEDYIKASNIDSFNVLKYDLLENDGWDILEELQTVSFFSDRKMVIVKHFDTLIKKDARLLEAFVHYIEKPNQDVVFIMVSEQMIDQPESLKQAIQRFSYIEKLAPIIEDDFPKYVISMVKKHQYTIDEEAVDLLIERTKKDLMLIQQELEKLMLFSYETKHITEKAVSLLVSRNLEENIYELTTALISKNQVKTIEVFYDLMSRNEDPLRILSNIVGKIRELMHAKLLLDKKYSKGDIEKHFNITSGRAYYLIQNANQVTFIVLEDYLNRLSKLDLDIKSGVVDKRLGLELFLLGG